MNRTVLILVSTLILTVSLPAHGMEFTGEYTLEYPVLFANFNMGIVRDGEFRGFDENIDLTDWDPDAVHARLQEILDLIDGMDGIPDDVKSMFRDAATAFFQQFTTYYDELYGMMTGYLPGSFGLTQLPWPLNDTMWVTLEGIGIPWPGQMDPDSGEFTLQTLVLPVEAFDVAGWDGRIIGLMLGTGQIDRARDYAGDGTFRVNAELLLESDGTTLFAGLGAGGAWAGLRQ